MNPQHVKRGTLAAAAIQVLRLALSWSGGEPADEQFNLPCGNLRFKNARFTFRFAADDADEDRFLWTEGRPRRKISVRIVNNEIGFTT
jgi:hypothetical protein